MFLPPSVFRLRSETSLQLGGTSTSTDEWSKVAMDEIDGHRIPLVVGRCTFNSSLGIVCLKFGSSHGPSLGEA